MPSTETFLCKVMQNNLIVFLQLPHKLPNCTKLSLNLPSTLKVFIICYLRISQHFLQDPQISINALIYIINIYLGCAQFNPSKQSQIFLILAKLSDFGKFGLIFRIILQSKKI